MNYDIECPFCDTHTNVPLEWLKKNGRVFCPTCCKSFDILVKEDDNEDEEDNEEDIDLTPPIYDDGEYW